MSYDLRLWSVHPPDRPEALPDRVAWDNVGDGEPPSGSSWQIVVTQADRLAEEDVPAEILPLLAGIGYLTHLHLEPVSAPKSARALLHRVATTLAKQAHGVIEDPQEDSFVLPPGVKRFPGRGRPETFSVLELSWWFLNGPLVEKDGAARLIDALESLLPEALPVRYGLYEPPQHRYESDGRAHFREFLSRNLDRVIVWYPARPVAGVTIAARPGDGFGPWGFHPCWLSITVEASALELPGWEAALRRLWRRISLLVQPFYGDVRTLNGYLRSGATYAVNGATEQHPVFGASWNGLPATLGHAAVLGPPYQALWPELQAHAELTDGLWLASTGSWREPEDLSDAVGPPPDPILQPSHARPSDLGDGCLELVFPFRRSE